MSLNNTPEPTEVCKNVDANALIKSYIIMKSKLKGSSKDDIEYTFETYLKDLNMRRPVNLEAVIKKLNEKELKGESTNLVNTVFNTATINAVEKLQAENAKLQAENAKLNQQLKQQEELKQQQLKQQQLKQQEEKLQQEQQLKAQQEQLIQQQQLKAKEEQQQEQMKKLQEDNKLLKEMFESVNNSGIIILDKRTPGKGLNPGQVKCWNIFVAKYNKYLQKNPATINGGGKYSKKKRRKNKRQTRR
jgi:hypothetical protein